MKENGKSFWPPTRRRRTNANDPPFFLSCPLRGHFNGGRCDATVGHARARPLLPRNFESTRSSLSAPNRIVFFFPLHFSSNIAERRGLCCDVLMVVRRSHEGAKKPLPSSRCALDFRQLTKGENRVKVSLLNVFVLCRFVNHKSSTVESA